MDKYMKIALKEAEKAYNKDEVPVGCVLVKNDKIIAKSHNNREKSRDVLGHAEIKSIKKAAKKLKTWKLYDVDMYVTLKPCIMCEIIIKESRIRNVYYLLDKKNLKKQYKKTTFTNISVNKFADSEYITVLSNFFRKKR